MKKTLFSIFAFMALCLTAGAVSWNDMCIGKGVDASWYATAEAQTIADKVLSIQKNSGGWMKNLEINTMTDAEINTEKGKKSEHSCLDNVATTREMRFLAKVYQGTKVEKYKTSFNTALRMVLNAQMKVGGWGQYWPRSGGGSYQDYITFNDDLFTNVMKILRDIYENKGDFADIADEATREKCKSAFDRGLQCIIKCQVDDNGTPAAWCAQHDTIDYLPTEGRPHELPSISGYESAALLSFLMSVENPSEELQNTITTAIEWLDNHKYMDNAKVEDFTNTNNEADRRVVSATGSALWARFIQIGGESGRKIYNKLFTKLQNRNKKRSYTQNGTTYTYTEYEIAKNSYDATKAYQPIYSIYADTIQHLYYRFLYNYEDADSITDWKGCEVPTSLNALRRTKYQFLGSWCYKTIHTEYPAWKQKMDIINNASDATAYELSNGTNTGTNTGALYNFKDGFSIGNNNGSKNYSTGKNNTVKYTQGVTYTINIPANTAVTKVTFYGYDNYTGTNSYISSLNGVNYSTTDYVFPQKETAESDGIYTTQTITLNTPATGSLPFVLGGKQTCLIITVYTVETTGVEKVYAIDATNGKPIKYIKNNKLTINKNGKTFDAVGKEL
ncbi:MAG: pectate lyase [Prevotella sp.]|nr:pectate lyase [Prevotella sp.]